MAKRQTRGTAVFASTRSDRTADLRRLLRRQHKDGVPSLLLAERTAASRWPLALTVFLTCFLAASTRTNIEATANSLPKPQPGQNIKDDLCSLHPDKILTKLDLTGPGLEAASQAKQANDRIGALKTLLEHYRRKYPLPAAAEEANQGILARADQIVNQLFGLLRAG